MFRSSLRPELLSPLRMGGLLALLAELAPALGLLLLFTAAAIEHFIPVIGQRDRLLVGYLSLQLFIWLCPPNVVREHATRMARGPLTG